MMLIQDARPHYLTNNMNSTSKTSLWCSSRGNRTGNDRGPFYVPVSRTKPCLEPWRTIHVWYTTCLAFCTQDV